MAKGAFVQNGLPSPTTNHELDAPACSNSHAHRWCQEQLRFSRSSRSGKFSRQNPRSPDRPHTSLCMRQLFYLRSPHWVSSHTSHTQDSGEARPFHSNAAPQRWSIRCWRQVAVALAPKSPRPLDMFRQYFSRCSPCPQLQDDIPALSRLNPARWIRPRSRTASSRIPLLCRLHNL